MPLKELLYVSEFAIELAILVRRKGSAESVSTIGLVLVMILVMVLVVALVLVLVVVKNVVAVVVIGIVAGTHFYL
jgi:hypothetical protein